MNSIDKLLAAAIILIMILIAYLGIAGLHGKYRDSVVGRLHDDCLMCDIYRFSHSSDAAFAIREAKRKETVK